MEEIWKTLVYKGNIYDELEISSIGRLRNKNTGLIYKTNNANNGFVQVTFWIKSEKKSKTLQIHRCVAEAFVPKVPGKEYVGHKNGDLSNNCFENLEWRDRSNSAVWGYDKGKNQVNYGEKHWGAKLSNEQRAYIQEHCIPYDPDFGYSALARKFNVTHRTISKIYNSRFDFTD